MPGAEVDATAEVDGCTMGRPWEEVEGEGERTEAREAGRWLR